MRRKSERWAIDASLQLLTAMFAIVDASAVTCHRSVTQRVEPLCRDLEICILKNAKSLQIILFRKKNTWNDTK